MLNVSCYGLAAQRRCTGEDGPGSETQKDFPSDLCPSTTSPKVWRVRLDYSRGQGAHRVTAGCLWVGSVSLLRLNQAKEWRVRAGVHASHRPAWALHVTCVDQEAGCGGRKGHEEKPLLPSWYKNEKLQGCGVTCPHLGSPRRPRPATWVLGLRHLLPSRSLLLFPSTSGRGGGLGGRSPRL